MVKERCFILIALVVVILLISDFGICDNIERDEGEVLEFNIKEETARGIIDQKYPDTAGIDIVTDAPWRVIRGRDIPLLIFVPDANLEDKGSNSFHGLNFKRITVFLDSKIIYEDKMDANPSHGVKFKVVDENGKRASSNIAGERHVNSNSSVQCDVSKPGGWHRIIRIPSYMIKKRGMYVYLKTEIVANPVYDKPVNKPIFFSRTLRVYVANGPFPSLGKEWRYYDAHFHTIAEWSLGNKLLSPRKAFGGPIQMIKESSLAMGLIPSIYSFADRVIATDHNAFFSDDYVVPVGPSTGRHKEFKWDKDRFKSERGHIEYENLRDVFGITFGEEITLKTDFKKGGFNGGSHLILLRGEHVDGPWHGGLLSWRIGRKLFGGEENDNTLQSVLNNAASQQTVPFAFAAHPFAKGVHWNMKEGTERYLELLHDNTHDFVTKDGIRKFVFKGVQYWNEKNDYILTVEKAIRHGKRKNEKVVIKRERNVDFFDLHPFAENMSKTRFPPEKGFFKVKERYPAFSPNPDWDNDLKRGLFDWHERIRRLLRFSFGNIPKNKSVEIFPRKIYMFGGSDAHGDFNYQTSLLATILDNKLFRLFGISNRKMTSNAFAKVRTYVNFNGKPGEDNEEKSLNALADGNSVVTDGPVLTFGFDSDIRFNSDSLEWYAKQNDKMDVKKDDTIKNFNCDGRIGGDGNYDGGFTALVVKGTNDAAISYRWNNSGASGLLFGAIDSIKLYVEIIY